MHCFLAELDGLNLEYVSIPDYGDPRAAYLQIADDLRQQIQAGKLKPGDRLPSRRDLARRYGVAPETIRRSIEQLDRERLTNTQSTRGTYVLKQSAESAASVADVDDEIRTIRDELARINRRLDEIESRDEP